jgi:hypothetical protein
VRLVDLHPEFLGAGGPQSLTRLAERGGLSPSELLAVVLR